MTNSLKDLSHGRYLKYKSMQYAFKRPLWLEIAATVIVFLACVGHVASLWHLLIGIGVSAKRDVLLFLAQGLQYFLRDSSRIMLQLKDAIRLHNAFLLLPEWYKTWFLLAAGLDVIVATSYFFAAYFLWTKKKFAVKFIYWSLGSGIILHALNVFCTWSVGQDLGILNMVFDREQVIALLAVIILVHHSDKSSFDIRTKDQVNLRVGRL